MQLQLVSAQTACAALPLKGGELEWGLLTLRIRMNQGTVIARSPLSAFALRLWHLRPHTSDAQDHARNGGWRDQAPLGSERRGGNAGNLGICAAAAR